MASSTNISDPNAYYYGIVKHGEVVRTLLKFWRKLILTGTLRVSYQKFPKFQYFDTKLPIVVFITSNYIGNTEIMQGCKENNIPCFGTLWDFVRIVYFYTSWTILTDAVVKKTFAFRKFTTTYTYLWSGVSGWQLTLAIDFLTLHYAWAWMPHCINSHGQCQIYFRTYSDPGCTLALWSGTQYLIIL